MGKTINRRPFSVNVPSGSDIKKYYFNHVNWKGICTDKNYFNIDQETFESATNVYMDNDAILKSRPALRVYNDYVSNVLNVWKFDNLIVYLTKSKNANTLVFKLPDKIIHSANEYSENVKLLAHSGKIWIFDEKGLFYFDGRYVVSGDDYIYTPINTVTNDDVETLQKEDNLLTTKKINRYIYDFAINDSVTYSSIYGKDVTLTLNDETIDFKNFTNDYLSAILKRTKYKLTEKNIADEYILGPYGEGTPLVQATKNGKVLLLEYTRTHNASVDKRDKIIWTIYYSDDAGNIFREIATVDEIMGLPALTDDGESIGIVREDGVYFIRPGETVFRKVLDAPSNWPTIRATTWWESEVKYCDFLNFNYNTTVKLQAKDEHNFVVYNGRTVTNIVDVEYGSNADILHKGDGSTITVNRIKTLGFWTDFPLYEDRIIHTVTNDEYKLITTGHSIGYYNFVFPVSPLVTYHNGNYTFMEKGIRASSTNVSYVLGVNEIVNGAIVQDATHIYYSRVLANIYDSNFTEMDFVETDFTARSTLRAGLYRFVYDELNFSWRYDFLLDVQYDYIKIDEFTAGQDVIKFVTESEMWIYNTLTDVVNIVNLPIQSSVPLYFYDTYSLIIDKDNYLRTSKFAGTLVFDEVVEGETQIIVPDYDVELDAWYFATGDKLYISQAKYDDDGKFLWNFPKILSEQFTYDITNLHIISDTQVAVFFEDHVWIVTYDIENGVYKYNKSRLQVGCKKGNDILTSYDGSQTIFSTSRGLVSMSYQDFVSSTEQTLTYLSDSIFDLYKSYNDNNIIKLQKYDFWIFCYAENGNDSYVFDVRNNSWWYWKYPINITKMYLLDDVKLLSNNELYSFFKTNENYYDEYYNDKELIQTNISWSFTSQKLHLSTLNYYKNVENITVNSVQEDKYLCTYNLLTFNYREGIDKGATSGFEYYVDKIRTYVKWINYGKLTAFQYTLNNDFDYAIKYPLSLNSIIVKYKLGGAVR